MLDFIDIKTIFLIIHLFGVALGAGGAFTSDAMFFLSIRDKKFTTTEIRFLKLGSLLVWTGLAILVISGLGLFSLAPEKYLASSKFIAKMVIVAIITLNGVVMHLYQLPLIIKTADKNFSADKKFMKNRSWILFGGAISVTSWSFSIILGALKTVPYSVITILSVYVLAVITAIIAAQMLKKYIFGR